MVTNHTTDTRAKLVRIFTFLGGIYFFLYFVLPESAVTVIGMKAHHEQISNGFIVIGAMALGLGLYNIMRAHGARVVFQRPGWFNSLALLVGLFAMIAATSAQWIENVRNAKDIRRVQVLGEFATRIVEDARTQPTGRTVPPVAERVAALVRYGDETTALIEAHTNLSVQAGTNGAASLLVMEVRERIANTRGKLVDCKGSAWERPSDEDLSRLTQFSQDAAKLASSYSILKRSHDAHSLSQKVYDFLFDGLFNQLGSAMFALLGVYIAAAAYRAFRVRTIESGLMMTAAVIVMLGQISFGKEIYEHVPSIRQWLLEVPNSAAFRAIRLGAGVAGLMLAIRMWLSIESRSFSSGRK
ncbi:MAG: hypothetical protein RIS36_2180 [Pseudomonadota bacterium]|jgi:hypothetical protein